MYARISLPPYFCGHYSRSHCGFSSLGSSIKKPYYRYGNGAYKYSVMKYFLDGPPHNERVCNLCAAPRAFQTQSREICRWKYAWLCNSRRTKQSLDAPRKYLNRNLQFELSFCISVISLKTWLSKIVGNVQEFTCTLKRGHSNDWRYQSNAFYIYIKYFFLLSLLFFYHTN